MDEIDKRNFHIIARLIIIDGVVQIILPDEKIRSKCDDFFKNRISKSESKSESEALYDVCLVFKDVYFFEDLEEKYENKEIQRSSVPWFNEALFESNRIPIIYCITGVSINNESISLNTVRRSANFMDSSIWTYCLDESSKPERVNWVLQSIYNNYQKGYYNTCQAREFLNLNVRLSQNSYLEGNDSDVAHGQFVVPFLFHSEYKARMTLDEIVKNGNAKADRFCCGYKWRFLLVDDHAEVGLSVVGCNDPKTGPSKIDVILDRLRSIDGMKIGARKFDSKIQYSDDYNIIIEYVSNLKECKEALEQKKYDIILMDYLLGDKRYIEQPGREYSYELFDCVKDLKDGTIGPGKRLYFMFISAYVHAIQERLDERLISRSTKDWFIGRGACPLNTPEIFLYHLHSIMQKRVATMLEVDSKVINGGKTILCQMFDTPEDLNSVCRERFVDLLNLISHIKTLVDNDLIQKDTVDDIWESKDSVLARSIFEKDNLPTDKVFWEHFRHLCYLMGYELKSRWPEWWEEFHFLKVELDKYGETYKGLLEAFRKHIVDTSQVCK